MREQRVESRAQAAGVNARALARRARKAVEHFRGKLQKIAYEWDELCPMIDGACTEAERALDELEERLTEAVDYANKPIGSE